MEGIDMLKFLIPLFMAAGLLTAGIAKAQNIPCGPLDVTLQELGQRYSEKVIYQAVTADGNVMKLLVSPTGTWSVLYVFKGDTGRACMMASGDTFSQVRPIPSL
jgi:hypothetical protein